MCQKFGVGPRVGQCPAPGQHAKFANVPPPGMTRWANAPEQPGGREGGGGLGAAGID